MEGDTKIAPNPLCSGPLIQSDPQTHLLPVFSSCDQRVKHTRSGRVHGVSEQMSKTQEPKGRVAAQRSSRQNTSPTKRARETSMVQISQSLSVKLMRADTTHKQKPKKTTSDLSLVSGYQTKHKDKTCRMNRAVPSSAQNVDEPIGGKSALDPDCNRSDVNMDKGEEFGAGQLVPQSPPPARGWVIVPFFQSFKSKMASFTEIVMSPVRLFKPNDVPPSSTPPDSPKQLDPDRVPNSEHSESKETPLNNQFGKMDGNVEEGSTAGTDPGLPQSQGQDEEAAGDISCKSRDSTQSGLRDRQAETHFETGGRTERHSTAVQKDSVVQKCSFNILKTHRLPEEDECTFEGRQTSSSMLASDEQNDTMLFTMTEKETNNNDSVPFMLRSQLVKSSFEQSPESTQFSSSSSLSNTSAPRGSELDPNVEMEEQMGLTGAQRRPLQRKRGNKSKTKSSTEALSSEISCHCITASGLSTTNLPGAVGVPEPSGEQISLKCTKTEICHSGDNDTSSALSSSDFHTPPVSLCLAADHGERDGGLHESNGMSVCSLHLSVRRSLRKAVTANDTAPKMGASSEPLQKQQVESEGKKAVVVSTKGKRRLKAAALLDAGRDSEKRKREMMKGEKLEEGEEKESVFRAGFESSTLALLEHKEHMETVGPRTSNKREGAKPQRLQSLKWPTQNYSSAITDLKVTQEPVEMSAPVTEGSRETGSGRKGRKGKQSASLAKRVTSSAIGPGDAADDLCIGSLSEGNSRSTRKRYKITDGQDCFSSTKRLKEKSGTCFSHSESDSNTAGDMELETTVTASMVKANLNDQAPEGLVRHSDTKGHPRTSDIQKKGSVKKRKVDDVMESYQNRRKCGKSNHQPDLALVGDERSMTLPPGADPEPSVQLNEREVEGLVDNQGNDSKERVEEVFSCYAQNKTGDEMVGEEQEEKCTELFGVKGAAEIRHCTRELRKKPRKAENQKRRRKALAVSRGQEEKEEEKEVEEKEVEHGMPGEQVDLARVGVGSSDDLSRHLQRSHSCPEIPSLRHHDSPWSATWLSPHRGRALAPPHRHQSPSVPPAAHFPKSFRRARRHTVCSVEVEREIPPLCLRKEVYPTRRSSPCYGKADRLSPRAPVSPSSFSAQASCFMSSPLAFLSKKTDRRGVAAGVGACNYVASSSSSPSVFTSPPSPSCSSAWRPFPGTPPCGHPRSDISSPLTSLCSALSQIPLEGENEARQQSEEEFGEDNSCSSQDFESMVMREEKALSDSEIKTRSSKHEKQGKVSSIRIRRSIPKPQNNLTPMGLPRTVRLKKKEFSLEEIYTNKNFNKPPEGRLETIFEVPLNRRNGSQSLIGLKRMKRYMEFPEVGGTRKPRKSLVGAGKVGISRPRRGGYPNSKDDPSLSSQELDSLLCSKLDQLDYWLAFDQETP